MTVPAPRAARPAVVGAGVTACGTAALVAGVTAVTGPAWSVRAPGLLPLSGVTIALDPLSGVFVGVVGLVAVCAGVFGIGYTARGGLTGRTVQAALPLFVLAMLLVPAAGSVGTLLLGWELMASASLLLVLAEHHHRPEVASAGRWYAVMTHLGFVAVLAGLLLFAGHAADGSFPALRAAAAGLGPGIATAVFALVLVGFGSKAGIVPLHAWLPRAHPEAPSHVSALMSAAMVTMGVYGLVRVGFDLLGGGPAWWWVLVLLLGAASAVYGILQAAVATDLKVLLGYSTTENMGLVLVGVGAAGLFAASGQRTVAGLALAAALLHVLAHAAFKTLLFLAAGSVVQGTGTRDLDELGGLRTPMPVTTAAFGLGALAGSALPPGAAFVGEWLLLQALVHGLPDGGVAAAVVLPVAVAALALTAGMAVVTFVKAFGVGFLARPRSAAAAAAVDGPATVTAGLAVAGTACALLGLLPYVVLPAIGRVAAATVASDDPVTADALVVRLAGFTGSLSPLPVAAAVGTAALAVAVAVRLLAPGRRRATPAVVRPWDCGAGPMPARTEYTATSFAEPLQRVFDDVVRPESDVDVTHHRESRYLVDAVRYRLRVPDRIEHRLYLPVLAAVRAWGRAATRLADGSVHRYLGYGFVTLCGALAVLAVTR
ncbi:proton-conducting transporter membrane subunit [Pseudonocardia endophytica]|uniref:proton-conducting transporter transmembrane domain-containing protein n=1 Tax=Pseudonocardia endophytica TaxID=401976 RepID=UPI001FB400AE|nr:proton-conducting transporter membrane subunit [Pseudonocardia endophytica]